VVRGLPAPLARLVRGKDRGQAQGLIDHLADEGSRVVLREPVLEGRGSRNNWSEVYGLKVFMTALYRTPQPVRVRSNQMERVLSPTRS
jgi:hypothetical protein